MNIKQVNIVSVNDNEHGWISVIESCKPIPFIELGRFQTESDAIKFCKEKGWEYDIRCNVIK